jgi:hypothetical protein
VPAYRWSCICCDSSNAESTESCSVCACPARVTALQAQTFRQRYLAREGALADDASIALSGPPAPSVPVMLDALSAYLLGFWHWLLMPLGSWSIKRRNRMAAIFYLASATGPLGVWYLLLFASVPTGQKPFEYATFVAGYLLSQSQAPWYLVLLIVAPIALVALALSYWCNTKSEAQSMRWVGAGATLLSLVVCWPSFFTSALATYYAFAEPETSA